MSQTIVFVHGWGFDARIWDQLRAHLSEIPSVALDLGFRDSKSKMPEIPAGEIIAVGHSLGFLWLLKNRPFAWRKIVSVNGFSKFLSADDFPSGLDARILNAMIKHCKQDAPAVVVDFFKNCGHDEKLEAFNQDKLVAGLLWLRDWDIRETLKAEKTPVLALAGTDDPIVPQALTEASFSDQKRAQLQWQGGGHLLPLSAPAWCADHIRDFIASS